LASTSLGKTTPVEFPILVSFRATMKRLLLVRMY
jgi:hypothetical protein